MIPFRAGGHAAAGGAFSILRFPDEELPDVVYIEHLGGAVMLDGIEEIEIFSRALDRLTVDAETPDRSRQILAKAIAEL